VKHQQQIGRDLVALILAIGLATALNVIVVAILYDSISNPADAGISENATQILTGWGGGIIGILGAVFGYQAGTVTATRQLTQQLDPAPDPEPEAELYDDAT